jgi:PAS domain S-box-containing protein
MDTKNLNIDKFIERAEAMYDRLTHLYNDIYRNPSQQEILPKTYVELGSASEILKTAIEELFSQNEELIKTQNLVEMERQRYQNLFEEAPDGYLVTNTQGIIQEANRTAVKLLNLSQQYLIGKPITNYVALNDRQSLRNFLSQLLKGDNVKEFMLSWQKRNGELFDGACTVKTVCTRQGKPIAFLWLLRDLTERKLIESGNDQHCYDLSEGRPLHQYCKGETIPLDPGTIWYVNKGVVKLNTLCETGEEVLVGLVAEGMVFGSSLTMLQTYQATALLEVHLVPIYLTEIAVFPTLNRILLTKINHRLRQTEAFVAIGGRRRVKERFYYLLQLLKQEIGEPVEQGTRLKVRLTHEEFSSACCTTRVTITRLIGKLQKQGIISFDSNNHMILKDILRV